MYRPIYPFPSKPFCFSLFFLAFHVLDSGFMFHLVYVLSYEGNTKRMLSTRIFGSFFRLFFN